jgi:hypothetical protein
MLERRTAVGFHFGREALGPLARLEREGVRLGLPALRGRGTPFAAIAERRTGGTLSARVVASAGGPGSLSFDSAQALATAVGPPPFSGVGRFRPLSPRSVLSWTGSLSVAFAGLGRFPLTGDPIRTGAGMARGEACAQDW